MKKILVLNGSPQGKRGNCAKLAKYLQFKLGKEAAVKVIHLKDLKSFSLLEKKFLESDGFIFISGTYWDSWGSPLQWCLEQMTPMEGSAKLMGKPTAVFVLMHSVGGKSVLSRLQGVLSTMGLLIPPMSGMVYSLVNQIALQSRSSHSLDFWQLEDIDLILQNLILACERPLPWRTWPVDRKDPRRPWLKLKE